MKARLPDGRIVERQKNLFFWFGEELIYAPTIFDDDDHFLFELFPVVIPEQIIREYGGKLPEHLQGHRIWCTCGSPGDGYTNYIVPYLNGLVMDGHQVFAFGFAYNRRQHNWHFGVSHINVKQIVSVISTLVANIEIDAILVVIDVPHLIQIHEQLVKMTEFHNGKKPKVIGVSAIEADPLPASTTIKLLALDKFIAISDFGYLETSKAGINSVHVPALIDTNVFIRRTDDDLAQIKSVMGFTDRTVFFVNADGNERKNTGLIFEALGIVKRSQPNIHLVLLTRKASPMSWDYEDLMIRFGLMGNVTIFDRTLNRKEVADLYRGADFHLNVSKAAGLELSILESQACGTPVIAGDWCGMSENIRDGKGIPLPEEFHIIDIFQNGLRRFVSAETLARTILEYMEPDKKPELDTITDRAYNAVVSRDRVASYKTFIEALNE